MRRAITAEDKLKLIIREIGLRYRVYRYRVVDGKMSQRIADREIAVLEAIAGDYRELAIKERVKGGLYDRALA
jgi:hypothetical protein